MKQFTIDVSAIDSWDSFHDTFSKELSFPNYYGRNMNAWIDCVDELAEDNTHLVIQINGASKLKNNSKEIFDALNECSAFVNYRLIEANEGCFLSLSYIMND